MDRDAKGLLIAGIAVSLFMVLLIFVFGGPFGTRHQEARPPEVGTPSPATTSTSAATAVPKQNQSSEEALVGEGSETMCGRQHKGGTHLKADCTRACIKQGSAYALVVGQTIYLLNGDNAQIDKFAGKQVVVKGKVAGETITVESIAVRPKQ